MKYVVYCLLAFSILAGFASGQETPSSEVSANNTSQETQATPANRGNFAIGYSTNYPLGLLGVTFKAGLTDRVAAEVILAPIDLGDSSYSIKGSYEFIQDTSVRAHAFGVVGIADSDEFETGFQARGVVGLGIGAEYSLFYAMGIPASNNLQYLWTGLDFGFATSPYGGITVMLGSNFRVYF